MLSGLMKESAKFFALLLLLLPVNSFSLGLGEINLHSALNQPLDAEIELLSLGNTDAEDIAVKLAPIGAFEKAGIERPFFLTKFKFTVAKRINGDAYLKITSHEPVKEPFLDFIIEANWPNGRILREYTLLLDPPVLVDERPAALDIPLFDEVLPVADGAASPEATTSTAAPSRREIPPFTPRGSSTVATSESGEITYGPVKRTDTLWSISSQMRPDSSVTVQQVMIALLNENPEAFDNQNINDLKAGYFLRISDPAVISETSANEAERIAKTHYEQWVDAKHSTALAAGQRPLGSRGNSSGTGSSDSSVSSRLTLVAPEEGVSQAGSGSTFGAGEGDVRQELAFALESADVSRQENEELRKRLSALEGQLASMQRLITLKGDTLSAMQVSPETLAATEAAANEPEILPDAVEIVEEAPGSDTTLNDTQPTEVSATAEPKATSPPVAVPPMPPVETSMVDEALAMVGGLLASVGAMLGGVDPMIVLGGLGVIGLLVAALVMRRRKAAAIEEAISDFDSDVTPFDAAEEMENATSDEAVESVLNDVIPDYAGSGGMNVSDDDEIDALAEADVYLAYRRFDKAEELLNEAVQNEPERHDLQVKLLEVYCASDKKDAFVEQAERLRSSLGEGSHPLWKNVAEMGRKIAPTSLLFNDEVDAVIDSTGVSGELDIDLPDLGGDLDLGDLDLVDDGASSTSAAPSEESDNPFSDVSSDELDALDGDGLNDVFDAQGDLGDLEASLDSAMEMVSNDESAGQPSLDVDDQKNEPGHSKNRADGESEFDSGIESGADDVLDLSDISEELTFEESVEPNTTAGDTIELNDENTLDLSSSDERALDEGDTAVSFDNDELAGVDDLEFETEQPAKSGSAEPSLGDDLELGDAPEIAAVENSVATDDALTDVSTDHTVSEVKDTAGSVADIDNEIEEDLFSGLDESGSGDDDWLSDLDDDLGDLDDSELFSAEDEVGTKLDLARAYIDMGDSESAKGILEEVVNDGNDEQKKDAHELIERIA